MAQTSHSSKNQRYSSNAEGLPFWKVGQMFYAVTKETVTEVLSKETHKELRLDYTGWSSLRPVRASSRATYF